MELAGKTTLITGGASGLGAACARMVASAGGRAVLLDVDADRARPLLEELGEAARFRRVDVTDPATVSAALAANGPTHVLVNCAGVAPSERVLGKGGPASLERFAQAVQVNLIGTFNVIRLAASVMANNEPNEGGERGVIVNTASIAAFDGQIGQAAYAASKAGIVGMTLPLARDLARHGIRVVTVAPGVFDTPLMAGFSEEIRQSLGEAVPFPSRLGRPEEFAQLVRHVVENPMLNGETIRLDGALRMGPK